MSWKFGFTPFEKKKLHFFKVVIVYVTAYFLQMEDGDFLLQENGDKLQMEP